MVKKGILLFLIIAILIAGGVAIFIKTDSFEKRLKVNLEQSLSSLVEDEVSIGSMSFNPYLGFIDFYNISTKKYGAINHISLSFSPLKLLGKKLHIKKANIENGDLIIPLSFTSKTKPKVDMKGFFKNLTILLKKNSIKSLKLSSVSIQMVNKESNKPVLTMKNISGTVSFNSLIGKYEGLFTCLNNDYNYKKISIPFHWELNFAVTSNSISINNFTINSLNSFLNLEFNLTEKTSQVNAKLSIEPFDFVKLPILEKILAEIQLTGDVQSLSGGIILKTKLGNISGGIALKTDEGIVNFVHCKCNYMENNIDITGHYSFKGEQKGDVNIVGTGKYFKEIKFFGDFKKKKKWDYNFICTLEDKKGIKSLLTIKNFLRPKLNFLNLDLPFLKASVKDNSGSVNFDFDNFKGKCKGKFFTDNIFEGFVFFEKFNLFETNYPKFNGDISVEYSGKVTASAIKLFDKDKGYGLGSGWFTKDAMNLDMELHSLDFKTGLFSVQGVNDLDIDGKIDGQVSVKGNYNEIDVSGSVSLHDTFVYQTVFETVLADFHYFNQYLTIDSIYALNGKDGLRGNGVVDIKNEKLDFHLKGNNTNIVYFPVDFFQLMESKGSVDVVGTLDDPIIKANMEFKNLMIGDRNFGKGRLNLNTKEKEIIVKVDTDSRLDVTTKVGFSGPISFDVLADNLKVDLGSGLTGFFTASFNGKGDFNQIEKLSGKGVVTKGVIVDNEDFKIQLSPVPIELRGLNVFAKKVNLNYSDSNLYLADTHVDLTNLNLSGEIVGNGKLLILKQYIKDMFGVDLTTDYDISGQISGTLENPMFQGNIKIINGNAIVQGLSFPITNINANCDFDPSFLKIKGLTATYGDGKITSSGFLTENNNIELKTYFTDIPFDFSGIYALLNGFVTVKNDVSDELKATGTVRVDRCFIEESQVLAVGGFSSEIGFLDKIKLAIALEVNESEFENSVMHLFVKPSVLSLQGSIDSPILLGTINFSDKSTISISDVPMNISRGNIIFENPFEIDPLINILAETEIQGYNISCRLKGSTTNSIQMNFSSNPPLQKNELLALLFGSGGVDMGNEYYYNDPTASNETDLTAAGIAMALNNLFSPFQKKVKDKFNVERFQLTPQVFSEKGDPSPIITVEKNMSSRLTGIYSQTVSGSGENLIQFKYRTSGGNYLIIRKEIDNTYTFEFEFIKKD